ncbi:hypothetical protein EON67_08080 [archaeon]|nr:MAG: hypothetical protein EON67_08080 [archaeon]
MGDAVESLLGVLVTSDAESIVYIVWKQKCEMERDVREGRRAREFIIERVDAENIVVRPDAVSKIRRWLVERVRETTYEDDDEAAEAAGAAVLDE